MKKTKPLILAIAFFYPVRSGGYPSRRPDGRGSAGTGCRAWERRRYWEYLHLVPLFHSFPEGVSKKVDNFMSSLWYQRRGIPAAAC